MVTLQDRARAFETQLAHDHNLKFRLLVQRSRILGRWAARLMGKADEEARTYVQDVVRIALERTASGQPVIDKIASDLGDLADLSEVRAEYARAEDEAKRLVFEQQEQS